MSNEIFYSTIWKSYHVDPTFLTNAEKFVKAISNLQQNSVVDIGCGSGRFCNQLSIGGWKNISGIDITPELLQIAIEEDFTKNINYQLLDFLNYDIINDVVLCLGTTLGSGDTPQSNIDMFNHLVSLVSDSGILIIDVLNWDRVAQKKINQYTFTVGNNKLVEYRDTITIDTKDYRQTISVMNNNTVAKWKYQMMYKSDLMDLYNKSNLCVVDIWGDYEGNPWNTTSERTIIIGKK